MNNLGDAGDVLVGITVHGHSKQSSARWNRASRRWPTRRSTNSARRHRILVQAQAFTVTCRFRQDNPWNQDISAAPVDPNSNNLIASIGLNTTLHPDFGTFYNGAPNGIPYVVVAGDQQRVPINFTLYGRPKRSRAISSTIQCAD